MVADLREGRFQSILLKATENDQSSKECQRFKINNKAVKLVGQSFFFMFFSEK